MRGLKLIKKATKDLNSSGITNDQVLKQETLNLSVTEVISYFNCAVEYEFLGKLSRAKKMY